MSRGTGYRALRGGGPALPAALVLAAAAAALVAGCASPGTLPARAHARC
ncbi:MAG: hypothetical protein MZW92_59035 [Comamonadaceae bacterium]|nr:hypothetical protein [Comamonadaceae bacterium]